MRLKWQEETENTNDTSLQMFEWSFLTPLMVHQNHRQDKTWQELHNKDAIRKAIIDKTAFSASSADWSKTTISTIYLNIHRIQEEQGFISCIFSSRAITTVSVQSQKLVWYRYELCICHLFELLAPEGEVSDWLVLNTSLGLHI